MEGMVEVLEHELEEAFEVKNKKSLHRYVILLTENIVKKENYEKEQQKNISETQKLTEIVLQGFKHVDKRFEEMLHYMDKRFEAVDKRFEQVDKRFEAVDKRFEQVDKRFEEILHYMDKRFEAVDKRFEEILHYMDKRFEDSRQNINNQLKESKQDAEKRFEDSMKIINNRFLESKQETDKRFDAMDKRFSQLQWTMSLGFTILAALMGIFNFY